MNEVSFASYQRCQPRVAWLDALAGDVDGDFVSAVREQPEAAERPELRKVFR